MNSAAGQVEQCPGLRTGRPVARSRAGGLLRCGARPAARRWTPLVAAHCGRRARYPAGRPSAAAKPARCAVRRRFLNLKAPVGGHIPQEIRQAGAPGPGCGTESPYEPSAGLVGADLPGPHRQTKLELVNTAPHHDRIRAVFVVRPFPAVTVTSERHRRGRLFGRIAAGRGNRPACGAGSATESSWRAALGAMWPHRHHPSVDGAYPAPNGRDQPNVRASRDERWKSHDERTAGSGRWDRPYLRPHCSLETLDARKAPTSDDVGNAIPERRAEALSDCGNGHGDGERNGLDGHLERRLPH
jgi:hypothetical protein